MRRMVLRRCPSMSPSLTPVLAARSSECRACRRQTRDPIRHLGINSTVLGELGISHRSGCVVCGTQDDGRTGRVHASVTRNQPAVHGLLVQTEGFKASWTLRYLICARFAAECLREVSSAKRLLCRMLVCRTRAPNLMCISCAPVLSRMGGAAQIARHEERESHAESKLEQVVSMGSAYSSGVPGPTARSGATCLELVARRRARCAVRGSDFGGAVYRTPYWHRQLAARKSRKWR
jgi:hypothetical protein